MPTSPEGACRTGSMCRSLICRHSLHITPTTQQLSIVARTTRQALCQREPQLNRLPFNAIGLYSNVLRKNWQIPTTLAVPAEILAWVLTAGL